MSYLDKINLQSNKKIRFSSCISMLKQMMRMNTRWDQFLFMQLHVPDYHYHQYQHYCYYCKLYILFYINNQIHSIHTRFKTNLHPLTANLTKFQKGVYYLAIKIFNNLPHEIKDLANDILPFQNALKRFLLANSFYNSKEYFNYWRLSIVI